MISLLPCRLRRDRIAMLAKGQRDLPDARMLLYSETNVPDFELSSLSRPSRKRTREDESLQEDGAESSDNEDLEDELDWRSKTD